MKPKVKEVVKDTAVGAGIGCAVIIPGISGGTIALVTGAFKKIVNAVDGLLSKYFLKNLLILLPFGVGALIGILGLYFPITIAFEHCMLALVCLFAGFMIGSVPSITDKVKSEKPTSSNCICFVIGFVVVVLFGVLSLLFNLNTQVQEIFTNNEWYLYPIILCVGLISSMGLIVPGFSGSMLLMVIGFYDKILGLIKQITTEPGLALLRLFVYAVGVIIGFIAFSKLMKTAFEKHPRNSYFIVLGFLIGSIIAIFVNDQMFDYFRVSINVFDYILTAPFLVVGFIISYLIVLYVRKHPETNE